MRPVSKAEHGLGWGDRLAGRSLVLMLALIVGCGGERQAESGTAGSPADTVAVQPADTVAPAAAETAAGLDTASARSSPAPAASPDTAGRPTETARAKPAPAARPKPAPKPAPADTQPSRAAQEPSAPAAAPAPTPVDTQSSETAQQPGDTGAQPADTGGAAAAGQVAPLRDAYHQAPKDTVTQVVYDGWKQYNLNCARCHGEDVMGTTIAPHLIVSVKPNGPINTQQSFMQVVCAGRPEKGMPAWCALGLEMDKINAIYQYVKGRSAGEIGPGRPAVEQGG